MLLALLGVIAAYIGMQVFRQNGSQAASNKATLATLQEARNALLGFAAQNGRLPCPAVPALNTGKEAPAIGGICTVAYTGYLPASTLGLANSTKGYLIDPWGNPIRYAITKANANAYSATTTDGIKNLVGGSAAFNPDLRVCSTSPVPPPPALAVNCSGATTTLINNAVAVVFSIGPNGSSGVAGKADEAANQNNDQVFVYHPFTDSTAGNGEFDDLMVWIDKATLINRMTQANRLP